MRAEALANGKGIRNNIPSCRSRFGFAEVAGGIFGAPNGNAWGLRMAPFPTAVRRLGQADSNTMRSGIKRVPKQSRNMKGERVMPVAAKKRGAKQEVLHIVEPNVPASLDRDAIAELAHSYWEARECTGGSPEEDWYRAETELMNRLTMSANRN